MAERRPVHLEHQYAWENGKSLWLDMRAYPVSEGLAVFYRDVSERHESESALQRSEARLADSEESLRLSTEAAEVGTWDLDVTNDRLIWSDRTKAMFGISAEAPSDMRDFYAGLHPDDLEATRLAFATALDPSLRTTYDVEYRTVGKEDGAVRWVAAKGKGFFDASGRCTRAIGTAIDITARKRSEIRYHTVAQLNERLKDVNGLDIPYVAAQILGAALNVRRVGYGTIDDAAETLHVERDWTAPGIESLAGTLRVRDYGSLIDSLRIGELIAIPDVRSDPRTSAVAVSLEARSTRSFVNVPIIERGRLVAVLYLNDDRTRSWRDDELALVKDVGDRTRTAYERYLGEQALRTSEARFEAIANSIDQMVWSTRPDGFHDYYNERWYTYTGVPPNSTDGDAWIDIFHPEDQPRAFDVWHQSLRTGEPYHIEYRLRQWSGQYRWVLGRAKAVRDAHGRITRWYGTCTDIHDMVETREVLSRSRVDLEHLVDARTAQRDLLWNRSSFLLAVADFDSTIREVNSAWQTLLGWSDPELVGRSYVEFVHPEDVDSSLAWAAKLVSGEKAYDFENRYRHKDGSTRWVAWSVTVGDGVLYCIGRDVTEHKEQAAALAAAEDALRQAQKMEAVGQLTGGLAHDFNNLLSGISGSLEVIERSLASGRTEKVDRFLQMGKRSAKRAAALTHRLLAFSRRQTLDPAPTNLNRLVREMEDLIRRTMEPPVHVEVVGAGGLWSTLVDANQLENALLNLCINARDAMPDGGRLTIETANRWLDARAAVEQDLPPGQYVSLSVTDSGVGMPSEIVAKAFDPFFTTKPLGEGTGLGLSMTYGFARQSGGQVRIYSELGRGTTVCIYLPRHSVEEQLGDAGDSKAVLPTGDGQVVMIIDDEPGVRMLVAEVLSEAGYQALEAADGPSGLRALNAAPRIDLLITDVGLPGGMNGRQVADAARSTRPDLKVLFITGYAENAVIGNGHLDQGMSFITKPFEMDSLARKIEEMLVTRNSESEA